jgi:hypothetical protein
MPVTQGKRITDVSLPRFPCPMECPCALRV